MRCFVTGAAGFIASHLCEHLLGAGHEVVAVDAFIPYYPREFKEANLKHFRSHPRCQFHELDLRTGNIEPLLAGVEVVFHIAATAGLLKSWTDFELYNSCNVTATQRLLAAVQKAAKLRRFIYASTSSVYGLFSAGDETLATRPISPYGVTKLAGEHLCQAHAQAFGLPLVVLRYFSVYGPRQRPDMGYYHFIRALLNGGAITVFGDGMQVRGNTYVDDCVAATIAAVEAPVCEIYNLGGGETASVWDILGKLEKITGRSAKTVTQAGRLGDQRYTQADTGKLYRHLGWRPTTPLDDGLRRQVEWQQSS
ncbi:MAG TPA: NAD-dependent epimerase/dehydratase family protein [Gemmataceae bacterium]|nr:NAD-dependent epimerase/dehydratase family protein [Gemmataceae bacterium]